MFKASGDFPLWRKEIETSLEHWDTGSNPGPAQRVKDLALLQLWHRSKHPLRADPWPSDSMCCGVAQKEKKRGGHQAGQERLKRRRGKAIMEPKDSQLLR